MRCTCCDRNLNDFESTRKHAETGEYLDICNRCLSSMDNEIPVQVRGDLSPFEYIDQEDDYEDDLTNLEGWDD